MADGAGGAVEPTDEHAGWLGLRVGIDVGGTMCKICYLETPPREVGHSTTAVQCALTALSPSTLPTRVSSSLTSLLCHCTMLYMLHQCRSTAQVASWVGWGASVAHVQCAGWVSGRLLVSRHWHIAWVDMNHSIIQSYGGGWVVGDGDDDRVSRRWSIV
jgi:hypothetical protein